MKSNTKWTIGIIIALVGLLLTAGFFNNPNIILVRQFSSDYTCPDTLYSSFEVTFSNKGTEGTSLCVSLNSPNKNITFTKEKDCLYSDSGEQTSFKLQINDSSISKISNATINYNYLYQKFFFTQNHTISCFYSKENSWESLKLKTQETLN
ncbi:hypothetical protein HYV50_06085 [Candidatus Pacearchaeota archaeon]|nr:hypothetical protein [Candidatus Pacearchaeota archaeon]